MRPYYHVEIDVSGQVPETEQMEDLIEVLSGLGAAGASVGLHGDVTSFVFAVDVAEYHPKVAGAVAADAIARVWSATERIGMQAERLLRVEVTEGDAFEQWLELEPEGYVGVSEIAQMLGVSRQRVSELRSHPLFPAPIAELAAGPIWTESSLRRFVDEWPRRPGRPAMSQETLRQMNEAIRELSSDVARPAPAVTEWERQVLEMAAMRPTIREAAEELGISAAAARSAIRRAMAKLEVLEGLAEERERLDV